MIVDGSIFQESLVLIQKQTISQDRLLSQELPYFLGIFSQFCFYLIDRHLIIFSVIEFMLPIIINQLVIMKVAWNIRLELGAIGIKRNDGIFGILDKYKRLFLLFRLTALLLLLLSRRVIGAWLLPRRFWFGSFLLEWVFLAWPLLGWAHLQWVFFVFSVISIRLARI